MNPKEGVDESYKWPYYDSYAPKVPMYKPDKQVVQDSIHKQYFPSETGQFTLKHLQARHAGIKQLERKYMERVKSANSPSKTGEARYVTNNKLLKYASPK